MNSKITSFRQIIELWPSLGAFAEDIGVVENTAKLMRHRDSIHSNYWIKAVEAAKTRKLKGVSLEVFARLQAEKKIIAGGRKAA